MGASRLLLCPPERRADIPVRRTFPFHHPFGGPSKGRAEALRLEAWRRGLWCRGDKRPRCNGGHSSIHPILATTEPYLEPATPLRIKVRAKTTPLRPPPPLPHRRPSPAATC